MARGRDASKAAAQYRHRKVETDRLMQRYKTILRIEDYHLRILELAELAERLGRWFEARGWWSLVGPQEPESHRASRAVSRLQAILARAGPHPGDAGRPPGRRTLSSHAAVVEHHAVTAVGVYRFEDEATIAGLHFEQSSGATPQTIPQTVSGGVAVLDYDGDGWLDVYAVQGGNFPPDPGEAAGGDRLFHNRGDGTFEDVTGTSGIGALRGRVMDSAWPLVTTTTTAVRTCW